VPVAEQAQALVEAAADLADPLRPEGGGPRAGERLNQPFEGCAGAGLAQRQPDLDRKPRHDRDDQRFPV
jgi:hypothetical protein